MAPRETLGLGRPLLVIELHGTNAAVCAMLDKLGYVSAVLGSPIASKDVEWDANILAVPRERLEHLETAAGWPDRSAFQ